MEKLKQPPPIPAVVAIAARASAVPAPTRSDSPPNASSASAIPYSPTSTDADVAPVVNVSVAPSPAPDAVRSASQSQLLPASVSANSIASTTNTMAQREAERKLRQERLKRVQQQREENKLLEKQRYCITKHFVLHATPSLYSCACFELSTSSLICTDSRLRCMLKLKRSAQRKR